MKLFLLLLSVSSTVVLAAPEKGGRDVNRAGLLACIAELGARLRGSSEQTRVLQEADVTKLEQVVAAGELKLRLFVSLGSLPGKAQWRPEEKAIELRKKLRPNSLLAQPEVVVNGSWQLGGFLDVTLPTHLLPVLERQSDLIRFWPADSPAQLKEKGTIIRLAGAVGAAVIEGQRMYDFRLGKRDYQPGPATFEIVDSSHTIPITILDVSHTQLKDIPMPALMNQGVWSAEEAWEFMVQHYPDITLESEVTVIHFRRR